MGKLCPEGAANKRRNTFHMLLPVKKHHKKTAKRKTGKRQKVNKCIAAGVIVQLYFIQHFRIYIHSIPNNPSILTFMLYIAPTLDKILRRYAQF